MTPADSKGHGQATGDLIHMFQSGTIQIVTDVGIDPAGDVWVANNWTSRAEDDHACQRPWSRSDRPGAWQSPVDRLFQ